MFLKFIWAVYTHTRAMCYILYIEVKLVMLLYKSCKQLETETKYNM